MTKATKKCRNFTEILRTELLQIFVKVNSLSLCYVGNNIWNIITKSGATLVKNDNLTRILTEEQI